MRSDFLLRTFCMAALFAAPAPAAAPSADPLALIARIQQEVADIRGLSFKQAVPVEKQTVEGFARHMDSEMSETAPGVMAMMDKHFDKVARRLGLYRGPVIDDFRSMLRTVMTSQVAAYYDPDTGRVYIIADDGNELQTGLIYSHELYHALQDQYFNLNGYTDDNLKLDGDQTLARVAVIEGEATYIHTLWATGRMLNSSPPRALIGPVINMQAQLKIDEMRQMISESGQADAAQVATIPPFILEIMVGNYLKGAAFVFAVQEQGWSAVEKLYKEYPPQSTEQILHPEKWFAREGPASLALPDFRKQRALNDWELIDDGVLGEIQLRIIFNVQGLEADAESAAAGWDGDRYAVFKRKKTDETLLLLRTAWDNEAEASQFAAAYRKVQPIKYEGRAEPMLVEQQGTDVFIVEGGRQADLAAFMKVVKLMKKTRA